MNACLSAVSVIASPLRGAAFMFFPWPRLVPILFAPFVLTGLVHALTYLGAFGSDLAGAIWPERAALTPQGRKAYALHFVTTALGTALTTDVLWYFLW